MFLPQKIEEFDIISDKIPEKDLEGKIAQLTDIVSIYKEFYEEKTSFYDKMTISRMYNFYRRKGCFLMRVAKYHIQRSVTDLSGNPEKKLKDSPVFVDICEDLSEFANIAKFAIFANFENLEKLKRKEIDSLLVIRE